MGGGGQRAAALIFLVGLGVLLAAVLASLPFAAAPMQVGQEIVARAPGEVGAANIVTAIVLAYRGLDTLGEVTILFVAATAAGLVLAGNGARAANNTDGRGRRSTPAGFILDRAAHLLQPFLLMLGAYIVIHGHLTPGGGFQGGAILAAAFLLPLLASPAGPFHHGAATLIEGFAGATFVVIGLASLMGGEAFLTPLLGKGSLGELLSAGSLPLLYLAIGLKVGSELAGLLHRLLVHGGGA